MRIMRCMVTVAILGTWFFAGCAYRQGATPLRETKAHPAPSAQYVPIPDGPLPDGSEGLPLTSPHVLYLDVPRYPNTARATDMEGTVLVELTIDQRGVVSDARVVETTSDVFNAAALEAAYRCRFNPGKVGEVPVPFRWMIPFEFALFQQEEQAVGGMGGERELREPQEPPEQIVDPQKTGPAPEY